VQAITRVPLSPFALSGSSVGQRGILRSIHLLSCTCNTSYVRILMLFNIFLHPSRSPGRTFPAGERGSAAGSLLSSHCPNCTWACVLCRPSPELPFHFGWFLSHVGLPADLRFTFLSLFFKPQLKSSRSPPSFIMIHKQEAAFLQTPKAKSRKPPFNFQSRPNIPGVERKGVVGVAGILPDLLKPQICRWGAQRPGQ
jgi:hypothetical protein